MGGGYQSRVTAKRLNTKKVYPSIDNLLIIRYFATDRRLCIFCLRICLEFCWNLADWSLRLILSYFLLAQKVSKKACRHNAPWFSGLKVGKTDGLIFILALGWLLDSPLIFAWFSSLKHSGIWLMFIIQPAQRYLKGKNRRPLPQPSPQRADPPVGALYGDSMRQDCSFQ